MKLRHFAVALAAIGFAACSSNPDKLPGRNPFKPEQVSQREQRAQAAQLYAAARDALDSSDYGTAAERYDNLAKRFPFTDYAIQGQLEKVYAEYRAFKPDEALTDADHFLRDYPRHANADYVQYLKGLINFDRDRGFEAMLGIDVSKRDITNLRRSFDDFQLLIQKYPNSRYNGDARLRMIDLRNRIADHDMTVVRYYMRRGAYIAAARRAEQIVAQYPGSPATLEALTALETAYRNIGLNDQAANAHQLHQAYIDAAARSNFLKTGKMPKKKNWFVRVVTLDFRSHNDFNVSEDIIKGMQNGADGPSAPATPPTLPPASDASQSPASQKPPQQ
ncbi:outer membrane protein assembly factor BamD [Solimonas soli]|uniref:outer membrane protein assembly factor BamD n=1 Tax=Solimonas soli TaxID=413479 RepID=UPI0004BC7653|nr:outer membrane protein assembly factor BamD [Solimonas soli]